MCNSSPGQSRSTDYLPVFTYRYQFLPRAYLCLKLPWYLFKSPRAPTLTDTEDYQSVAHAVDVGLSSLLNLPAERRFKIYDIPLTDCRIYIKRDCVDNEDELQKSLDPKDGFALLATSKKIRMEALPYLRITLHLDRCTENAFEYRPTNDTTLEATSSTVSSHYRVGLTTLQQRAVTKVVLKGNYGLDGTLLNRIQFPNLDIVITCEIHDLPRDWVSQATGRKSYESRTARQPILLMSGDDEDYFAGLHDERLVMETRELVNKHTVRIVPSVEQRGFRILCRGWAGFWDTSLERRIGIITDMFYDL